MKNLSMKLFILPFVLAGSLACQNPTASKEKVGVEENQQLLEGHLYSIPFPMVRTKNEKIIKNVFLLGNDASNTKDIFKQLKEKNQGNVEGMKVKLKVNESQVENLQFGQLKENWLEETDLSEGKDRKRAFKIGGFVNLTGVVVTPAEYFRQIETQEPINIESVKNSILSGDPLLFISTQNNSVTLTPITHSSGKPLAVGIYPYLGQEISIRAQSMEMDELFMLKVNPDKDIENLGPSTLFED